MNIVTAVIETADVEILSVRLFKNKSDARDAFESICEENSVVEETDLSREAPGTVALAGDDAFAVQMLELQIT